MSFRATNHATLEAIYPFDARAVKPSSGDDRPTPGSMAVSLREPFDACTTGVVGNDLGLFTWAASGNGFDSCFLRRGLRRRVLMSNNRCSAGACCLNKERKS